MSTKKRNPLSIPKFAYEGLVDPTLTAKDWKGSSLNKTDRRRWPILWHPSTAAQSFGMSDAAFLASGRYLVGGPEFAASRQPVKGPVKALIFTNTVDVMSELSPAIMSLVPKLLAAGVYIGFIRGYALIFGNSCFISNDLEAPDETFDVITGIYDFEGNLTGFHTDTVVESPYGDMPFIQDEPQFMGGKMLTLTRIAGLELGLVNTVLTDENDPTTVIVAGDFQPYTNYFASVVDSITKATTVYDSLRVHNQLIDLEAEDIFVEKLAVGRAGTLSMFSGVPPNITFSDLGTLPDDSAIQDAVDADAFDVISEFFAEELM